MSWSVLLVHVWQFSYTKYLYTKGKIFAQLGSFNGTSTEESLQNLSSLLFLGFYIMIRKQQYYGSVLPPTDDRFFSYSCPTTHLVMTFSNSSKVKILDSLKLFSISAYIFPYTFPLEYSCRGNPWIKKRTPMGYASLIGKPNWHRLLSHVLSVKKKLHSLFFFNFW